MQCSSTLPYALSKWPEHSETRPFAEDATKKYKLKTKSDSDTAVASRSSPVEVRRKLSLLEEKRAIFQRRFFDSTRDARSGETVIAVHVDGGGSGEPLEEGRKKKARQISVRTFDTFSTFEDAFEEDRGLGYLRGIEEDYTESYDREDGEYSNFHAAMAPMVGAVEHPEKVRLYEQHDE